MGDTLGMTFLDLIASVGRFLGLGASPAGDDLALCKGYANDGIRAFLLGLDPRTGRAYQWRFLSPDATLSLTVPTGDYAEYDLPADFAAIVQDPILVPGSNAGRLVPRSMAYLRSLYSGSGTTSGVPCCYGVFAAAESVGAEQGWKMLVWPKPNATYTLRYRYRVNTSIMQDDSDVPPGGPLHAQTVEACALAAAEMKSNDTRGIWSAERDRLMAASIDLDASTRPASSGEVVDPSTDDEWGYSRRTTVTYP